MTYIFDGKEFAASKKLEIEKRVQGIKQKGPVPQLVSILVGDDPASVLYVNLKKKAAENIGCELLVVRFEDENGTESDEIVNKIRELNSDKAVHGIMVQLPLPGDLKDKTKDIINVIAPEKDVDGMRDDSPFFAPVVKAVLEILEYGLIQAKDDIKPFGNKVNLVIVGSNGFVGGKLIGLNFQKLFGSALPGLTVNVDGQDLKDREKLAQATQTADIIISATGSADLISVDMIQEGCVLIDVGAPKGDISKDAYEKAGFVSPVPGGVGPVTISCLMDNLVNSIDQI